MSTPIEEYALLSNCRTAALVSLDGSVDWLCLPRLDSPSSFAALLGTGDDGRWSVRPAVATAVSTRRYDGDTFILVTRWECEDGVAEVHDFMPILAAPGDVLADNSEAVLDEALGAARSDVVRLVIGISGTVTFDVDLRLRFDYARAMPWMRQTGTDEEPELTAIAGPDAVVLRGVQMRAEGHRHRGSVSVSAGERVDLTLTWFRSHRSAPGTLDTPLALEQTRAFWQDWADRIEHGGVHGEQVIRSLLTLRALTNRDTGGIAAAATTSLPEDFGGERNWDYRYVWLRDAALTLEALLDHGFVDSAEAWRTWLVRAVAGDPSELQIMYGLAGERHIPEHELMNLPGYLDSRPVRVGNGAALQYQADVIGEVMLTLSAARAAGATETDFSWQLQKYLVDYAAAQFDRPDSGLWEVRGEPQRFTHSRVMMWATFDRAVRAVEVDGLSGPVERWRELRDRARAEIDTHGVSNGHFTQHYATSEVDASLLLFAQVGYCERSDPRMLATVERIEQTLLRDGLVMRYRTATGVDGLSGGEHPFLACSFWLVEQYAGSGRVAEAEALMRRLCGLANDVGLLSEEYDPVRQRHVGNFPQAFSHLALVRAADALAGVGHRER